MCSVTFQIVCLLFYQKRVLFGLVQLTSIKKATGNGIIQKHQWALPIGPVMVHNQTMAVLLIVWHSGNHHLDINGQTILAIGNTILFVKSKCFHLVCFYDNLMFCEVTVYFPFLLIYFTMCEFHNKQPYSQDALSDEIQMNSVFQIR